MQCFICGLESLKMTEVRSCFRYVGHKDICLSCGNTADNIVGNYWGVKSEINKERLRKFMLDGVIVNKEYEQIMYSGYYQAR